MSQKSDISEEYFINGRAVSAAEMVDYLWKDQERHTKEIIGYQKRISDLENINQKIQEDVSFREKQNDALFNQYLDLQNENKKLNTILSEGIRYGYWNDPDTKENEQLKSDLEQSRKDLDDMRRKYSELYNQNTLTTEWYQAFAISFCKASQENDELRALISEGDDSHLIERLDNQRDNIKAYQMTIRNMEDEIKSLEHHGKKNKELQTRLAVVMDHVEDLLIQIQKLSSFNHKMDHSCESRRLRLINSEEEISRLSHGWKECERLLIEERNKTWWQKLWAERKPKSA